MKKPEEIKRGLEFCATIPRTKTCIVGCVYYDEGMKCIPVLMADAHTYIQQLEAKVPQWISVEERLPEIGRQVLVYAIGKVDGFIGERVYALCERFIFKIFNDSLGYEKWSSPWEFFHTDYEITHWMPLPEPPKEDP